VRYFPPITITRGEDFTNWGVRFRDPSGEDLSPTDCHARFVQRGMVDEDPGLFDLTDGDGLTISVIDATSFRVAVSLDAATTAAFETGRYLCQFWFTWADGATRHYANVVMTVV
jgi:hypothetical protein